jgi:hypothetical protein
MVQSEKLSRYQGFLRDPITKIQLPPMLVSPPKNKSPVDIGKYYQITRSRISSNSTKETRNQSNMAAYTMGDLHRKEKDIMVQYLKVN